MLEVQILQPDHGVCDLLIVICFVDGPDTVQLSKLYSSLIWSMLKLAWLYFSLSPSLKKYLKVNKANLLVDKYC